MTRCRWILAACAAVVFGMSSSRDARADDIVYTSGQVFTADGTQPLAKAAVSVFDEKGRPIGQATTDAEGRYTLALPCGALHFSAHRNEGGIGGILKGAKKVLSYAAPLVGIPIMPGVSGNPFGNLNALSGLIGKGNPLGGPGSSGRTDVVQRLMASGMSQTAAEQMARGGAIPGATPAAANDGDSAEGGLTPSSPGAISIKVSLEGRADLTGVGQVFWVREQSIEADGKTKKALTGLIDPVVLGRTDAKESSRVVRDYLRLASAEFEPTAVHAGQRAVLTALLPTPPELAASIVVIARRHKSGQIYELRPAGDGIYRGEIEIDSSFAPGDQDFSVLAYAQDKDQPGRSQKAEDAIKGAGMWKIEKAYVYNPLIAASKNRIDLKLTVGEPAGKP